jgi:hypothetical protein
LDCRKFLRPTENLPFVYMQFEIARQAAVAPSQRHSWHGDCVQQLRGSFSAMGIAGP